MKILKAWPEFVTDRDGFAYSPYRQSDVFDGMLYVDIIIEQPWEFLPPSAVDVIRHKAAKAMVLINLEDRNKAEVIEQDYLEAFLDLKKDELEIKKRSFYSSPSILRRRGGVRPIHRRSSAFNPVNPGG
jgi:hypothetical protein